MSRLVLFLLIFLFLDIFLFILKQSPSAPPLLVPLNYLPAPSPTPTPAPTPVAVVGLVGDLGLGRYITATARAKQDFSWSFKEVKIWLSGNDFTLANLESPIINDCPPGLTGTFTFCGDKNFLPYLKANKFVFNLNNNHILNYRLDGLSQTQQYLSGEKIDYFYDNFVIKDINGIKFGFLGFDFVTYSQLDTSEILKKVKTYDSQVDWLIVSIHWGNEYLPAPETWRVNFAHQLVEAGADIIHGHHPHVWQGIEDYHGKKIYYSFGNFIFDQNWSKETSNSQIVRLTFSRDKIMNQEIFPIKIQFNSQPVLMP